VRPERIDLHSAAPAEDGAIAATVTKRIFSGEQIGFELQTAAGVKLICTKPSLPRFRALGPGNAVWLVPGECRALPVSGHE